MLEPVWTDFETNYNGGVADKRCRRLEQYHQMQAHRLQRPMGIQARSTGDEDKNGRIGSFMRDSVGAYGTRQSPNVVITKADDGSTGCESQELLLRDSPRCGTIIGK